MEIALKAEENRRRLLVLLNINPEVETEASTPSVAPLVAAPTAVALPAVLTAARRSPAVPTKPHRRR